jgi:hypothetical protein
MLAPVVSLIEHRLPAAALEEFVYGEPPEDDAA